MKSAAGAGGTTIKKKRKKKKKGERKKGGPKVMPVRGPSAFVVEEPADSIRRLKSTGHGRLKPIQTFIDEEPGEEQGVGAEQGRGPARATRREQGPGRAPEP